MRKLVISGLILTTLASCASQVAEEKPLAAEAMPISFGYGTLGRGRVDYAQAMEPHSGQTIKRMTVVTDEEWAMIDVRSVIGDRVFITSSPRRLTEGMLKDDVPVQWGERGTVAEGSRPVNWQRLDLADPAASCLALTKALREHPQGAPHRASQEVAIGIFCRQGTDSLPTAEIVEIAHALRTKR